MHSYVTCLIHTYDMSLSYLWHDSFTQVSFIRDMTHPYTIHSINMGYDLYTGLRLQAQLRWCLLEFAPRGRGALSHIHINESRTIYVIIYELNIRCGDVYWNSRLDSEIHFACTHNWVTNYAHNESRIQCMLQRSLLQFATRGRGPLSRVDINSGTIYIMRHDLNT